MAAKLDSQAISQITQSEKELTGSDKPVEGGPAAQAMKHAGEDLTEDVIRDIAKGEMAITGGRQVKGGPTTTAQSISATASGIDILSWNIY
jgi:hypothetical protein